MAKRYVFVRMPADVYNIYKGIQVKMQADVSKIAGKSVKVTMPKVFRSIVDPNIRSNYIEVDLKKLLRGLR